MKVGGNASMTEFFTKQGGTALLNDSDTKKKYSSRQGQLYREELERRVQDDAQTYVFLSQMNITLQRRPCARGRHSYSTACPTPTSSLSAIQTISDHPLQ